MDSAVYDDWNIFNIGGGKADDIYDRKMELAYPNRSDTVLTITNELQYNTTNNLKPIRIISSLDGLFGIHDCLWEKNTKALVI